MIMRECKMSKNKGLFAVGIIILFIGLAVSPGIIHTAAANVEKSQPSSEIITFIQDFSTPIIIENEQYVRINLEETNSFSAFAEAPMMPFYSKTYPHKEHWLS